MNDQPAHVAYNMAPSTTLTPPEWRHVSIHPDGPGRFKLCGYASAMVWQHFDLKALGVHPKGYKVWNLTKDRALEIGQQIEDAMRNGGPLKPQAKAPDAEKPISSPQPAAPKSRKPKGEQQSFL